jgi:hypothetical protein
MKRFSNFYHFDSDSIEAEFSRFEVDNLPNSLVECNRIDVAWSEHGKVKPPDCAALKYAHLSKLMLCILVIPHSNADSERVFSGVRKNQTDSRPNLSVPTLESLLMLKTTMLNDKTCCYERKFSNALLQKAKSATCMDLAQANKTDENNNINDSEMINIVSVLSTPESN